MLWSTLAPGLVALAMATMANAESAFSDLASCGQECIDSMDTTIGCVPVTSECLCSNSNFLYGIRDCATSACTDSADATAAYSYASSSCAAVLSSTTSSVVSTTTSSSTISSTESTTTTATPDADADTVSTSAAQSSSVLEGIAASTSSASTSSGTAQSTSVPTSSSAKSTSTSDVAATQDTASGMTTAYVSATTGSSAATSGGGAAAAASSSSASGSSTDYTENEVNLSTGAKVGIVFASASGAVAIVGIVMYLSRKRSPPLPRGNLKISEPLPGSGRVGDDDWENYHKPSPTYAPQNQKEYRTPPGTAVSNMAELNLHARPYEEMVPRVTPARMV